MHAARRSNTQTHSPVYLVCRKHFPAVNWSMSFSKYEKPLKVFYDKNEPTYLKYVAQFSKILQEEKALQEIVQLVGKVHLPLPHTSSLGLFLWVCC
jgi:vacuolar-type H+-ATPase catalytic subunit A/Vma1